MAYNTTFINDTRTFYDLVQGLNNDMTGGFFIGAILLLVFTIILISMKDYDTKVVMITAGFVTTMLGVIFWWAELFPFEYLVFPFIVLVGGIIVKVIYDS